jgi:uncharacterized protein (TIGR02271 family)
MANDYLHDHDLQNSSISSNRIVAFFDDKDDAYTAIADLRSAGFTSDQIGLAVGNDSSNREYDLTGSEAGTARQDKSAWQEIKEFFTGQDNNDVDSNDYTDFRNSTGGMNWEDDRQSYYQSGIERGGAVVTVIGTRIDEARRILEKHDADLRESGFDRSSFAGAPLSDREQRIQLRGELLRAHKERVQRGEVRLRKEVVTENQSLNVPVEREELVIERVPGSQSSVSGEIGDDREIRVPLSEERVRVDKKPVVNEEVRVGKRQVQRTEQVSDAVRHEELRVDREGDVEVDENLTDTRRKKPAA